MTPVGRPEIGTPINIRLGDKLLAQVDAFAESGPIKVSRASAVRSLIAAALSELDNDTIGSF